MILKMISPCRKLLNPTLASSIRNLSTTKALLTNHYEVLGVKRDASQAEIKNAYFKKSKMYHPDRIAATDENLQKFREISEAYEILGNEHTRRLYDRGLLGEVKRVGETAEPSDPIIAFYKQRQDMARMVAADSPEKWTQVHFEEVKKKKMHDLFSMKTTGGIRGDPGPTEMFPFIYFAVLSFLFYLNFEGSRATQIVEYVKEMF